MRKMVKYSLQINMRKMVKYEDFEKAMGRTDHYV